MQLQESWYFVLYISLSSPYWWVYSHFIVRLHASLILSMTNWIKFGKSKLEFKRHAASNPFTSTNGVGAGKGKLENDKRINPFTHTNNALSGEELESIEASDGKFDRFDRRERGPMRGSKHGGDFDNRDRFDSENREVGYVPLSVELTFQHWIETK